MVRVYVGTCVYGCECACALSMVDIDTYFRHTRIRADTHAHTRTHAHTHTELGDRPLLQHTGTDSSDPLMPMRTALQIRVGRSSTRAPK